MRRRMLKSKIHRATVTDANLNYVGSITLDSRLMELADIREHEQVAVLDIDNGARFETYAIVGGPGEVCLNGAAARLVHPGDKVIVITYAIVGGPGEVCLNGAAARLVHPGDKVIVITYADYEEAELEGYEPVVVHVDEQNRPTVELEVAS